MFREGALAFLGIKEEKEQEKKHKRCRHQDVCAMCVKTCDERIN